MTEGKQEPQSSQFVVHVILPPLIEGHSNEVSVECVSMDDVIRRIKEISMAHNLPTWQAISIFHIEDWPKVMEGASHV